MLRFQPLQDTLRISTDLVVTGRGKNGQIEFLEVSRWEAFAGVCGRALEINSEVDPRFARGDGQEFDDECEDPPFEVLLGAGRCFAEGLVVRAFVEGSPSEMGCVLREQRHEIEGSG